MRSHSSRWRSWPSDAGAHPLDRCARQEAVGTDEDMCISGCVRNAFGLCCYIIYFFQTNERQQKCSIAVSASRLLLVLSEVRTSTLMITAWKVRGQRTQRRGHSQPRASLRLHLLRTRLGLTLFGSSVTFSLRVLISWLRTRVCRL